MKRRIAVVSILALILSAVSSFAADVPEAAKIINPFYALDTGTRDASHQSAESQVAMLKELGYDGIAPIHRGMPVLQEMLAALDKYQLRFHGLYVVMNVEKEQPAPKADMKEIVQALKGRNALIMLCLNSKSFKCSSPEGDVKAVPLLLELSEMAREGGVKIALYPHRGSWVERVEDGVRLAKAVDRKNVGTMFNLCHWLMVDGAGMEARITAAMPYLFSVTINGADKEGKSGPGWSRLIMTLDKGDFDVAGFVGTLVKSGYTGPIGLQHYGIGGDAHGNLKLSIEAWKKIAAGKQQ